MKQLGLNSVSAVFGVIMILIVLSGAFAFAFTDFMDDRLFGRRRGFFVALLLAYAIYRGFRLYQNSKQARREN